MDGSNSGTKLCDGESCPRAVVLGRRRGLLITALKYVLAIAMVAWLCSGPLQLGDLLRITPSPNLWLLVGLLFASLLVPAIRWWWLLRIQHIDASFWQAIKLTWAGYLAAVILPGAVGGDLAKGLLVVQRHPSQRVRSLSTVVVDRLLGVYSLALLASMSAMAYLWSSPTGSIGRGLAWSVVAMVVSGTIAVLLAFVGPWRNIALGFLPMGWGDLSTKTTLAYWESKLRHGRMPVFVVGGKYSDCFVLCGRGSSLGWWRCLEHQYAGRPVGRVVEQPADYPRRCRCGRSDRKWTLRSVWCLSWGRNDAACSTTGGDDVAASTIALVAAKQGAYKSGREYRPATD